MRILAIDLVYSGDTGWVLWDTEVTDPVKNYGEWTIKEDRKLAGFERTKSIILDGMIRLGNLIEECGNLDVIVFEESDWHNSLGNKDDWKKVYARERIVQRTLGRVEGMIITATNMRTARLTSIGANEARREFGVPGGHNQKKRAAEQFALDFPDRFEFNRDGQNNYLYDMELEQFVSNHISDAFIIAFVQARRERVAELEV